MGFRTIVILNNDRRPDWEDDWALGKKIAEDQHHIRAGHNTALGQMGKVVECSHIDSTKLVVISERDFHDITSPGIDQDTGKISGLPSSEVLRLLKFAAGQLGFNLTKKRKATRKHSNKVQLPGRR